MNGDGGSGIYEEFEVRRCKLLHLEWMSNEVLLNSIGNDSQSLGIECDEDNMRKRMCIHVDHTLYTTGPLAIQQKMAEHCKSAIL